MDSNKIDRRDVEKWLEAHPEETTKIFTSKATPDMVDQWLAKRSSRKSLQDIGWTSESGTAMPEGTRSHAMFRNVRKSFAGASGSLRSLLSPRKRKLHRRNKSALRQLDEKELFMELIRDIADELDLNTLSHKILSNVSILTNGDRCSLFLVRHVRGDKDQSYLVSKLFDVTENSTLEDALHTEEEEIKIPFGHGIAGHVALTKETVNIKNAYEDPRFNPEIDKKTGYKTHSILCMPICSHEGEVVGVAQVINKISGSHEFTQKDEEVFRNYLTFCGIGIMNAQLFEMSVNEFKRNQMLLQLARGIFAEQTSLDSVVQKIMTEAIELMKCKRCLVFILEEHETSIDPEQRLHKKLQGSFDKGTGKVLRRSVPSLSRENSDNKESSQKKPTKQPSEETLKSIGFLKAFDLSANDNKVKDAGIEILNRSVNSDMAKFVAATGETINISEFDTQTRFKSVYDVDKEFKIRTVMCQPIYNSDQQIIGVAQMLNKCNKTNFDEDFTEQDEKLFEAFAIFCGLGIHNTQMYEDAMKLMAKQAVSLEVLSYHACAQPDEVDRIRKYQIPTCADFKLYDFKFSDFELSEDQTIQASLRMFLDCDLVKEYHIPYEVLCRWLLSVRKNYRPVIYHNWRHAFNVAQTMFSMFKSGKMEKYVSKLEIFVLLVACLCHDLDHRGTNNAFQQKTESALSQLYGTSTMEHHHFDHSIMILHSEGNNIFQFLSADDYRVALNMLENAILSTDLALYFKKRNAFFELVENKDCQWTKDEEKALLRGMMMTACDVSAITKPWEVQRKVAELVASEFFEQGDLEKTQLNETPIAMMDREKKDQLPKMQVGFIDAICLPVYKVFSDLWPGLHPLFDGVKRNRDNWQAMADGKIPDDEKALIEKERLARVKALEGGTPSNTPPPLTPAHELLGKPQIPASPLAANDKKSAPLATTEDSSSASTSKEPANDEKKVEENENEKVETVDKNGKVVHTKPDINGNTDVAPATSRSTSRSTSERKTKSKLCHIL